MPFSFHPLSPDLSQVAPSFRHDVPYPRLNLEQNPFQNLLDDRRSPLAPVPRSNAILAISLIAASVNTRSAP